MPCIAVIQTFGRLIPLKWDRGKFNILTYETENSICAKCFNKKMFPPIAVLR